ncbi:alkylation response protein AidB-like acyl-CoA dehydrogenase [Sphingopyxis panaciterrae]|uniref:acyl-CoA dehydrogenase family protein n=1 Tax=Sphingopyxis panaciterrae TaxID=363841 RepID=UPI00142184C4|nr:acyl-CoA dehydrogenase family protein [Sphingopyxis panaciterrae]NIJ35958.1 alkylation response protein AidB-like acyl-CoA dehydrogenase [Sphingopyxis panaciterrae]
MDMELKEALGARLDRMKPGGDGWQALADAGVLGLPFAEAHGGLGLAPRDGFAVLEVLGPRAIALPYLESTLLAGTLLDRAGGEAATNWLPRIAAGKVTFAFATLDDRDVARAEIDAAGWRLSGGKLLAIGAADADAVIVTATTTNGPAAFLLPREALAMKAYPTIDGRRAADLLLDDVTVASDARLLVEAEDIAEMLDIGAAGVAAEAAAIMARLVSDTSDYCRQREQFGQAISSFQAVQHRLVDMHIEAKRAAAAASLAADALDLAPAARAKAISAAKVTITDAGRFVGQNAVQLHGGMGMTEELPVSALFKRLTVIESEYGTRDEHLARYMGL